jgi:hypothetical protein
VASSVASSGIMGFLMEAAFDDAMSVSSSASGAAGFGSGASVASYGSGVSGSSRSRLRSFVRSSSLPPLSRSKRQSWVGSAGTHAAPHGVASSATPGDLPPVKGGGLVMSVPSKLADAVGNVLVPEFADKVQALFQFYVRISNRSGDGGMSGASFVRLMQDCSVVDSVVTISALDVQVRLLCVKCALCCDLRRRACSPWPLFCESSVVRQGWGDA